MFGNVFRGTPLYCDEPLCHSWLARQSSHQAALLIALSPVKSQIQTCLKVFFVLCITVKKNWYKENGVIYQHVKL